MGMQTIELSAGESNFAGRIAGSLDPGGDLSDPPPSQPRNRGILRTTGAVRMEVQLRYTGLYRKNRNSHPLVPILNLTLGKPTTWY